MSITARDASLFEILVSALYEQSESLWGADLLAANNLGLAKGQFFVLIPAALTLLREAGRKYLTERELIGSFERLSAATAVLPATRIPKIRTSARRAQLSRYVPSVDEVHDLPPEIAPVAPEPLQTNDGPLQQDLQAVYKLVPRTLAHIGPSLAAVEATPDIEPGEDASSVRFRPITRYVVADGVVAFELHPYLRSFMSTRRLVDWHRVPFAYVDLRIAAAFTSPYTLPIYRRLVAQAYDRNRRVVRYDENWHWAISADELAKAVGYRKQAGGLRGQIERNVIKKVIADLAKVTDGFQLVMRDKADRGDRDLVFDVHLPLPRDLQLFGRQSTYVDRFLDPSHRIDFRTSDEDKDKSAERLAMEAKRRADAKKKVHYANFRRTFPSACEPFAIKRMDPMRRMTNHLKLTPLRRRCVILAWQVAIDEVYQYADPYYGDVTGRGRDRRYRGRKLLETVAREGIERAFVLFALEEGADPDLTRPSEIDRLAFEGTIKAADLDRRRRLSKRRYVPAERSRELDGIEDYVAAGEALRQQDLSRERQQRAADKKLRQEKRASLRRDRLRYRKLRVTNQRTIEERAYDLAIVDFVADFPDDYLLSVDGKAHFNEHVAAIAAALEEGVPPPSLQRENAEAIDDLFALMEADAEAYAEANPAPIVVPEPPRVVSHERMMAARAELDRLAALPVYRNPFPNGVD